MNSLFTNDLQGEPQKGPSVENELGAIQGNVYQLALLNNMLPRGYKFELAENIKKQEALESRNIRKKKNVTYNAYFQSRKSEYVLISNEDDLQASSSEGSNKKVLNKAEQKRSSGREKKRVIEDLGYVDRDQGKKYGKLGYTSYDAFKKCERILNDLKKHQYGYYFLLPVDVEGYTERIKEPMDFSTVERKLKSGAYASTNSFVQDVRKIWNNAWSYNEPGTEIYIGTTEISNFFEESIKDLGDIPLTESASNEIQELKKQVSKVTGQIKKIASAAPQRVSGSSTKNLGNKAMTTQEKAQLKVNIMKLPPDKLPGIVQIIRDAIDIPQNKDSLEFDIDSLPPRSCRELEQFVKKNLPQAQKSKKKKPSSKTAQPVKQETV